jgi:hypothetical protein
MAGSLSKKVGFFSEKVASKLNFSKYHGIVLLQF